MIRVSWAGLEWEVDDLKHKLHVSQAQERSAKRVMDEFKTKYELALQDIKIYETEIDKLQNPVKYEKPKPPETPWQESEI